MDVTEVMVTITWADDHLDATTAPRPRSQTGPTSASGACAKASLPPPVGTGGPGPYNITALPGGGFRVHAEGGADGASGLM
jgi:hypothetical protein